MSKHKHDEDDTAVIRRSLHELDSTVEALEKVTEQAQRVGDAAKEGTRSIRKQRTEPPKTRPR